MTFTAAPLPLHDREHLGVIDGNHLRGDGQRRHRVVRYQRLEAVHVGRGTVTPPGPGDCAVILYADQQCPPGPVRETHDRLDEILVRQRPARVTLELHIECRSSGRQAADVIRTEHVSRS